MPDYAVMYKKLFQSMTRAIAILQEAQIETEELYISSEPAVVRIFDTKSAPDKISTTKPPKMPM